MYQQNLKTFLKHLQKNKLYTIVTVVGFSVSLTFVILLSVYLKNEYAVNEFHINKDRIYRLAHERNEGYPPPMGQVLQDRYPEIESYTRIYENSNIIDNKKGDKMMFHFMMADSTFFTIFSFPLIEGKPSDALKTKNSMVVTREFAHKLFGDEPVIGKEVILGTRVPCVISGVVDNIDKNSSFEKVDAIVNFRCLADLWGNTEFMNGFGNSSFGLYLLAKPNTNLPARAPEMLEQFKKDFWLYQNDRCKEVVFEPLADVYFSEREGSATKQNSKTFLLVLMVIVFSILGLAVINYMNLTIAQSGLRVKETAIRKLVGSSRRMLIYQYVNESILLCVISFLFAVLLSFASQSVFNNLFNSQINLLNELSLKVVSLGLLSILLLGIFSGIIPALIITRLNAVEVIKGSFRRKSKGVYSKMLIGFQYTVVTVLLMSSLMITKQTHFIQHHNLGYKSENVLVMDFVIDRAQKAGLHDRLMSIPGIKGVSFVCGTPIDEGNNQSFTVDGKPVSFQELIVDTAFFRMMEIKVQPTSTAYSKDGMWINQAAIKTLGLDSLPNSFERYGQDVPVLGVTNDFNYSPLYQAVGPLMIGQLTNDSWPWSLMVKMDGSNLMTTVERVKKEYSDFSGGIPFDYKFMDDAINSWYVKEVQTSKIVGYFTMLTILIAVMGIFAMSVFYLQQKVKEVGIRKVNGARVVEVMTMLNIDFVKWVLAAFLIATPIAYLVMQKWLQNFAYKTTMSWWIFATAGFGALGIAMLTVSWQSWRAATRNPVEALRYE